MSGGFLVLYFPQSTPPPSLSTALMQNTEHHLGVSEKNVFFFPVLGNDDNRD